MIWSIIGFSAAVLTMFSFVPQIIKVWKNKHAKDISPVMLFQMALGVSLWFVYGVYRKDPIIIIANITTFITLVILLFLYFFYGRIKQ
ncbi:MAG: SemiSWEET transporter [Candidatus Omnitrophica bacterium]|nr:SemiSWEET transporter [Candidatus Omnitrophota bacterium]